MVPRIGTITTNSCVEFNGSDNERGFAVSYDYYTIDVPGDCADTIEELAGIAIDEARDRARLYCLPALWTATRIVGDVGDWTVRFRVCRKRHKRAA